MLSSSHLPVCQVEHLSTSFHHSFMHTEASLTSAQGPAIFGQEWDSGMADLGLPWKEQ